jgi:hypothetical protein
MRQMIRLVAALGLLALAACSGSDGDSQEHPHRGQAGPYIGGSVGVSR